MLAVVTGAAQGLGDGPGILLMSEVASNLAGHYPGHG